MLILAFFLVLDISNEYWKLLTDQITTLISCQNSHLILNFGNTINKINTQIEENYDKN